MKITAERYEQIVSTIRADGSSSARSRTQERRGGPRVGLRMMATVVTVGGAGSERLEMRLRDVSAEGVGLLHVAPIPLGSLFCMLMERSTGGTLKAIYKVTRLERAGERQYHIGGHLQGVGE